MLAALDPFLPADDGHEVEADGTWLIDATKLELPPSKPTKPRRVPKREVTDAKSARTEWAATHETTTADARKELELEIASSKTREVRPLAAEASHSGAALLVSEGPPLEIGDALHIVMERVSLPDAEDLEDVAQVICLEAGISDHTDEVIELARRCLSSPIVKRALELGTYQREVPFTVPTADGYSLGRIDLVFRDGEDFRVVDYKTDLASARRASAYAEEHHAGQAVAYASALRIRGCPVRDIVFVYCRAATEVTVS